MVKAINRIVDWLVDMFGGFGFLFGFNAVTLIWFLEGRYNPHWFDKPPYNFYTGVVSWFAIVMSILILGSDKRSRARDEKRQRKDEELTLAILNISKGTQQLIEYWVEAETGIELDDDESAMNAHRSATKQNR